LDKKRILLNEGFFFYPAICRAVRLPPKKFSGSKEVRWGINKPPLIKVSLYPI